MAAGLPALVLEGLPGADAGALLASVIPGRLDERVRDRISVESSGNPLALLELPYGVTAAELAGGFGVVGPVPLAGRIGQRFRRRITPLPKATRRLLLLAAAEPGLLKFGARLTFRHPLIRAAVYKAAPIADRRLAHQAIAEATSLGTDPGHRSRAPIPITGPGTRAQAAPVLALIAGGHRARLPGAGLTRTASARLRPAWTSVSSPSQALHWCWKPVGRLGISLTRTRPSQAEGSSVAVRPSPGPLDHPPAEEHDVAARSTDVTVAFERSEDFREMVWVSVSDLALLSSVSS